MYMLIFVNFVCLVLEFCIFIATWCSFQAMREIFLEMQDIWFLFNSRCLGIAAALEVTLVVVVPLLGDVGGHPLAHGLLPVLPNTTDLVPVLVLPRESTQSHHVSVLQVLKEITKMSRLDAMTAHHIKERRNGDTLLSLPFIFNSQAFE